MSDEIKVGDRFEYDTAPTCPMEVTGFLGEEVVMKIDGGGGVSHSREFVLAEMRRLPSKPVGEAPEAAPVDWARWLPPKELPYTGEKPFREGQVWACADGFEMFVYRILGPGCAREYHRFELVAGARASDGRELHTQSLIASRSILVQDVNEGTPRDPAVLYGGPTIVVACKKCSELSGSCTCKKAKSPLPTVGPPAPTGCTLLTRSGLPCDLRSRPDRSRHGGPCAVLPQGERPRPVGVSELELHELALGPWRRR